ncbi:MAG: hypothetical protein E7595_05230 [Ruminococcaceae bacterium]|nr:hypothetical protein [Oscillospiraceae bacterium]
MKIIAFILALFLMFGLVGCFEGSEQSESSQVNENSDSSEISTEESIDPSGFFPDNMSPNDFVVRNTEVKLTNGPDSDTVFFSILYGYKPTKQTRSFISIDKLDLRSIEQQGKIGKDAARESHVVMLGDCLLIAIAVYDMDENVAYVVEDSTNTSSHMTDDRYYTHTDPEKANDGVNYGQAVQESYEVDEKGDSKFTATYGYPVWHYIVKEYNSIPEDYVLTLTEKLYDGDEVVSEEVTLTLTYQDIQELLS